MVLRSRIWPLLLVLTWLADAPALLRAQPPPVDPTTWPRFRGHNGSGHGELHHLPLPFGEADYNWRVSLAGSGHSSPAVWKDRIFVTGADEGQGRRYLQCLAAADGRTLWQRAVDFARYPRHAFNSFASSTPAVDGERVYVAWPAPDTYLIAAYSHDGRELWRQDLGAYSAQHGGACSPIVVGDLVILGKEPEGAEGAFFGLDRRTGAIRWVLPRQSKDATYATPMLYQPPQGGPQLILTSNSYGFTAVEPATGRVLWEIRGTFRTRCVGSPIQVGPLLFGTAGNGAGDKQSVAIRPPEADGAAPTIAYEIRRGLSYVPTPIAVGDRLYIWTDDGIVHCVDGRTGATIWMERVGGRFFGSPVYANGRLYCMSATGELVVLAAGDAFEVVARISLGEGSHATPAIANGTLYLRTERHLISVGGRPRSR